MSEVFLNTIIEFILIKNCSGHVPLAAPDNQNGVWWSHSHIKFKYSYISGHKIEVLFRGCLFGCA